MALIWGTTCDFPCPICLVPKGEMRQGVVYALRTTQSMKKVYDDACDMRTLAERDKYLQGYGLRGIPVCAIIWLSQIHTHTRNLAL